MANVYDLFFPQGSDMAPQMTPMPGALNTPMANQTPINYALAEQNLAQSNQQIQPEQPKPFNWAKLGEGLSAAGRGLTIAGSRDPGAEFARFAAMDKERAEANKVKVTALTGTPYFQRAYPNGKLEIIDSTGRVLSSQNGEDPLAKYMDERQKREVELYKSKEQFKADVGATAATKKEAGKELVQGAGGETQAAASVGELRRIANVLEDPRVDTATGPLIGLMPKGMRDVLTPNGAALQDNAERIIQQNLKAVLGGQFTKEEAERFLQRSYNPRQSEAENANRLRTIATEIETISQNKAAALEWLKSKGTLDGFVANLEKVAPATTGPSQEVAAALQAKGATYDPKLEYAVINGELMSRPRKK